MFTFASAHALAHESKSVRALAIHRLFFRSAFGASNIFAWILVFQLFYISVSLEKALAGVAALYALSHAVTFLLTPLAGMALQKGVRRALVVGTACAAIAFFFVSMLFWEASRIQSYALVTWFVVFLGMYRALYWIPYKTKEASLETSPPVIAREALVALMPALAGYVLTNIQNGALLFFSATALMLFLSVLVLRGVRESYEAYEWTYAETLHELIAPKNSSAVGLFILDGIQGTALLLIWPLAAFLILGESYQSLGAVLTATLCIAFLGRFLIRRLLRVLRAGKSPVVLATIVFSGWIFRLAAGSPVQILIADVYYNSSASPRRFSIDTYSFEQAADGGHFVDEYTALKEMGLSIGRIALSLLFITLALTTVESLAFAASIFAAAIAATWSVFIAHKLQKEL